MARRLVQIELGDACEVCLEGSSVRLSSRFNRLLQSLGFRVSKLCAMNEKASSPLKEDGLGFTV